MSTHDTNNAYENPNQNPDNFLRWTPENIQEYKEKVYDRISALLIEKLSQIDNGSGIQSLQKTYKDGSLVTGKSSSDVMVVYESDIEANADDSDMEDTILNWLNFAPLEQLTLTIVPTVTVADPFSLPEFILHLPDKDLNINQMLGDFDIANVNLKDNVSQFMGFSKSAPNINRTKFSEYVDTEISELTPITFTQFLEEYNKAKKRIPLFRYRTDDFFDEYSNSTIPIEYRIEKFFDEFYRIKDQIPVGSLSNVSSADAMTEQGLFGYRTMTYLLKEARVAMDDGGIPEWSVNQVMSFLERIDDLNIEIGSLTVDRDYWRDLYNGVEVGTGLPEEDEDCAGVPGGSAVEDECDVCGGLGADVLCWNNLIVCEESDCEDEPITGCTYSDACNYNQTALSDDGSCMYYVDCAGVCGGDSELDMCGICDGNGADECGVCGGDNTTCGWSIKSRNCHDYSGLLNHKAKCDCWCQNSNYGIGDEHNSNTGDCSKAGIDDEEECKNTCTAWCNSKNTSGRTGGRVGTFAKGGRTRPSPRKRMQNGGNTRGQCGPNQYYMPPRNGKPGYCMKGKTYKSGRKIRRRR